MADLALAKQCAYTTVMTDSNDKQHRYQKDKDGFKVEVTDPVQDVMNESELHEAESRIKDLIDQAEEE